MKNNTKFEKDFIEILFDGKNKEYGAYELRRAYNKRIQKAFSVMLLVIFIFIGGFAISREKTTKTPIVPDLGPMVTLSKEQPVPPPPPPIKLKQEKIKTTSKYTSFNIVDDDKLIELPPVVDNIKFVGVENVHGNDSSEIIEPPILSEPVIEPKERSDDDIYRIVQIPASFEGGPLAFSKFLQRHLNASLPSENGAPAGKYTVILTFIVSRLDGSISNIQAENDPGFGTVSEAIRVLQKSPKWNPAENNGVKVNMYYRQAITFNVETSE